MFRITDSIETNDAAKHQFQRAIKIAGFTVPAFDASTVPVVELDIPSAEDIASAVRDVAARGKNPVEDKGVQKLLLSSLLADKTGGFLYQNRVTRSRAELEHYKTHAPALLAELKAQFDEAVATMKEQIPVIGHMDLAEAMSRIGSTLPDRQAQAVTAAHTANVRTGRLIEALSAISAAALGRPLPTGGRHGLLTYVAYSIGQFEDHKLAGDGHRNRHNRPHNVWDLLNDGLTVELVITHEELNERLARLEREQTNRGRNFRAEAAQQDVARHQAKAMGFQ